jgi:copper resistance protein B
MRPIVWSLCLLAGSMQNLVADMNDDPLVSMVKLDKFEQRNDTDHTRIWDGSFWIGYDLNKIYLYSQGEYGPDGLETSQNELVYSKAISPYWDIQGGMAHDKNAHASRTWAEVAIAGLAPYYFETRAALLFNAEGNWGVRLDTEYELLITQRLIVSPTVEADFYAKDDPKMQLGSGLSSIEAGLRVRYEFVREFAPYIGVEWERTFGQTHKLDPKNDTHAVFGVKFWF